MHETQVMGWNSVCILHMEELWICIGESSMSKESWEKQEVDALPHVWVKCVQIRSLMLSVASFVVQRILLPAQAGAFSR